MTKDSAYTDSKPAKELKKTSSDPRCEDPIKVPVKPSREVSRGVSRGFSKEAPAVIKKVGNPDIWQLLQRSFSGKYVTETKAMEIQNIGCVLRTTVFDNSITETETLVFIPKIKIVADINNGKKVVRK